MFLWWVRGGTLLNLTHSVILINWSSKKSYNADSGGKERNVVRRQNIPVVGWSPWKYEYYFAEVKNLP